MTEKLFQDEIKNLGAMQAKWQKDGVQISADEWLMVNAVLEKLSFFSKQSSEPECTDIINGLRKLIGSLAHEVKVEEKELQAETNGGQLYTEDELGRINEYACRIELVQCLQQMLNVVYEKRPEFKPR